MACKRCVSTCGDPKAWPTNGCCDCSCHEYSVERYEPLNMMTARDGDRAVYAMDDGAFFATQLVMWAVCRVRAEYLHPNRGSHVIRSTERQVIAGMTADDTGLSCVEETSNFKGYAVPGDTDAEIRERFGFPQATTQAGA